MSCETNTAGAGRAAQAAGITTKSSKSAFVSGLAARVSGLPSSLKSKVRRRKQKKKAAKKNGGGPAKKEAKKKDRKNGAGNSQANGRSAPSGPAPKAPLKPLSPASGESGTGPAKAKQGGAVTKPKAEGKKAAAPRPQQHIEIGQAFSARELQDLSVQFRFDAAAARKQVQALRSGATRGIGHDDPRPADWVQADLRNYEFLTDQIGTEAKRAQGRLNLSSLSDGDLVDLWDFSRHEADQAVRFMDHLQVGGSHLKGATSDYLTDKYRLKGRFCVHIARNLEPMVSAAMLDHYERGD